MKILLVQPEYYTKYPPLSLLKIATYHKQKGNEVELVLGNNMYAKGDVIDITSLYTFESKAVLESISFYRNSNPEAQINVGGIFVNLMPDYVKNYCKDLNVKVFVGNIDELEDIVPDYSLVPKCNTSIVMSSRGCVRKCKFCGTSIINPEFKYISSIKKFIFKEHETITMFDNNFIAHPEFEKIVEELAGFNKPVNITQGFDIRLMTEDKAKLLSQLKLDPFIVAFDNISYKEQFISGMEIVEKYRLGRYNGRTTIYMLYNFNDSFEDLLQRIKISMIFETHTYLMKFIPLNALTKDEIYIDKNWTQENLDNIDRLRKILQTRGNISVGGYVYTKIPMRDYMKNIDVLWEYEAASSNTGKQRELFMQND